ncbi:hypothetical protein CFB46_12280 [Burkholderia sp. HI2761]|uniref:hypothetical protein n=1 Tax=unclassified Burkholderia TaxID=2613784 RepID=UPI000B7A55AC|nr:MULTISPECIES: hypothetical protein [unclassified Burkholderia]MPV55838.1 hypothetical protein [Burkholderia sp. BE24]OXJ27483.1 hypothetical protein CFB46_12280 [Burkholderia sp. HI2761]
MDVEESHETRRTLAEDVFYPDHEPRTESSTFRASKRAMKAAGGYVCAVCGDDQAVESHHRFFEWAFSHAIDWKWIRGVALNQVDTMFSHKLQRTVPIPRQHPVWDVIRLTQGFDWEAFDPARPETFVDSTYNQLLLCALHHRGKDHGRHEESDPVWSVQAFLLPGFVYSPDELKQLHAKESK